MLTSKLFCSMLNGVKRSFVTKNRVRQGFFNPTRNFHFTTPVQRTVELGTYEDLENYFAEAPNCLAVFDFYDYSNGLSKMQSSRIESKVDCADVEIDLIKVDVVSSAELADYFEVDVIPTLITFLNSEAFERIDGNVDDDELEEVIQALVEQVNQEE